MFFLISSEKESVFFPKKSVFQPPTHGAAMNDKSEKNVCDKCISKFETEELQALLDVGRSFYNHIDFDNMVSYVLERVQEILNSETSSIMLYDEASDEFCFSWVLGEEHGKRLIKTRFPVTKGIAGRVFRTRQPELTPDVKKDPLHYKEIDKAIHFETKSMITVPLQGQQKMMGVIQVINKREGTFDKGDLDFLSSMSNFIRVILDNAKMYENLMAFCKQLEEINKEKTDLLRQTREQNFYLRREIEGRHKFDQIKGNSESLIEVLELCEKALTSDIPVMINGETGTGKGLLARCIHYNSHRRDKPFVAQNCGNFPETLLASELFGYKKGAFTGALNDKRGLFEIANGGTIFLDEIAEMSPPMQVSLLRVLEEGEIRPLGAGTTKKVDVRVISATHQDLEECMKKGKFREDLFYRLCAFPVRLPPLRERKEDIPLLAQHFLEKFNRKEHKSFKGLTRRAQQCLSAYSFPGNIRELENEIRRAMAMAGSAKYIDVNHFSEKIRRTSALKSCLNGSLKEKLEAIEKAEILSAMKKHKENKTRVADELGLSRPGLIKKLKRFNLG